MPVAEAVCISVSHHVVSIISLLNFLLLISFPVMQGVQFELQAHTLPPELQSVNGSDLNGRCNNVLASAGIRFCSFSKPNHTSNLVDGVIPSVDNFDSGWADGFFTLNRNGASSVMVGFEFVVPVNITQVELVLFDCPVFGIGASDTSVYTQTPDDNGLFNFRINSAVFEGSYQTEQCSCDSTFTVSIPLSDPTYLSAYLFVVFNFDANNPNDWVFIAETRFSNEYTPTPTSTTSAEHTSHVSGSSSLVPVATSGIVIVSETPTPTVSTNTGSCDCSSTAIIASVVAIAAVAVALSAIVHLTIFAVQWKNKQRQKVNTYTDAVYEDPDQVLVGTTPTPATVTDRAGVVVQGNEAYGMHLTTTQ